MAIEIDKMFTVNEESLRHSLDILIGQRLNFRPISKEKLIELIKVDISSFFNSNLCLIKLFFMSALNALW